jgi:hypothetical protein
MEQSITEITRLLQDLISEQKSLERTPDNTHRLIRAVIRATGALSKEVEENRKELLRLRQIVENQKS